MSLSLIVDKKLYKGDNIYLEYITVFNKQFNIKEYVKYVEDLKLNLSSETYSIF